MLSSTATTVLPTGRIEMVLHYGDPFVQIGDGTQDRMSRAHIVGQHCQPITVKATATTGIVIVRFRPVGTASFLGNTLPALSNSIVDLANLFSRSATVNLIERLALTESHRSKVNIVEQFLLCNLSDTPFDERSAAAITQMNRHWGREKIDAIAKALGLSRRQFGRLFSKSVGTTPKKLSRVLRAQKAAACIRSGAAIADIVDWCGYADQSHLIHELGAHTRKRPSELFDAPATELHRQFNSTNAREFCGLTYL